MSKYLIGFALGLTAAFNSSQAGGGAVEDPVGFHAITVYGAANEAKRITPISVALVNQVLIEGTAVTVTPATTQGRDRFSPCSSI